MNKSKHKAPAQGRRFSFHRAVDDYGRPTCWRLFRRSSVNNAVHMSIVSATAGGDRSQWAAALWRARRALRDKVDAIDLDLLGVTDDCA